jgi:peptidoglycan/LPS O-acetylase OafA/YrhL
MGHVRQLDGFRAIAILIVFVAHCGLEHVVPGGFGVTIFFFLSGYLITSLLRSEYEQTDRVGMGAFYLRRTLRIWPPLYITIAVVWLAMRVFFPQEHVDPWGVLAQLAFVINYAYLWGHGSGLDLPLWSLAVEEHFYLLFPLGYAAFLASMPGRRAALTCFALCGLILLVRVGYAVAYGPLDIIYYWSHTRIDSILFGCCLALHNNPVLDRDAWRPGKRHLALALAALLICLVFRNEVFRQTLRYSVQGLALYVVFSFALHDRGAVARLLGSWPLRIVSLYSYTFYLVHVLIIKLCTDYFMIKGTVPLILVSGTATMIYCAAMHRFVEAPLARRRKQLHKVDAQATPQ